MNPKANAVLAMLLTSTSNSKSNSNTRYKTEKAKPFGTDVPKEETELVRVALVDAGRGWSGVKRECVLLKRKG